jgi:hypothetical protein
MKTKSLGNEPSKKYVNTITQISQLRREINYNTTNHTINLLVSTYQKGNFFIDRYYQRNYVWDNTQKCRFIESILLEYPIPIIFFYKNDDGRCGIADGVQRISALEEFFNNDLILSNLLKLTELNGTSFSQLPPPIQRKIQNDTLRVVELDVGTSTEVKEDIFLRINSSNLTLRPIKKRRSQYAGEFTKFLTKCAKNPLFQKLCPVSEDSKNQYEDIEMITRFFAFTNNYQAYEGDIYAFLDNFIYEHNDTFNKSAFKIEFNNMLNFVDIYFEKGFRGSTKQLFVPIPRFEAISVGVALALREKKDLKPAIPTTTWIDIGDKNGKNFNSHIATHAINNKQRVVGRIDYVKCMLLYGKNCQ